MTGMSYLYGIFYFVGKSIFVRQKCSADMRTATYKIDAAGDRHRRENAVRYMLYSYGITFSHITSWSTKFMQNLS